MWEVQLAVAELGNDQQRSDALAALTRSATVSTSAAFARTVLTHPARQHLPDKLLDHLATVYDLAMPTTSADWLADAIATALNGN